MYTHVSKWKNDLKNGENVTIPINLLMEPQYKRYKLQHKNIEWTKIIVFVCD
jgi:hypothetical protein